MLRKKLNLQILLILAVCLPSINCAAQPEDIAAKVDEYINAYVDMEIFSGSVLVAKAGEILVSKGYGPANIEHGVPNKSETKFRLGSITKQFTALAIVQLQEKGKLSVNDPITKFLPDCPNGDKITIHHLLTHTSGIASFTGFSDYRETMMIPTAIEEIIERFKDKPLEFEPGEKFSYCNSGYVLLGYVIEQASGQSYGDYVEENIFRPLGMDNTGYDRHKLILRNRADGYAVEGDSLINSSHIDMSIPHAAGALYSTVEDLYLWDRALYSEDLVSRESLDKIFTPFKANYGYGWVIREEFGRKVTAHGGGINGFSTFIARYVDTDAFVVVLSNREGAPAAKMARDLGAILFGEDYELPKQRTVVEVDAAELEPLVGEYRLMGGTVLAVTLEEGRLYIQEKGGDDRQELLPESASEFFLKYKDLKITFKKDSAGDVVSMVMNIGGRIVGAKKIE